MSNSSAGSTPRIASRIGLWSSPHRLVLTITWLATAVAVAAMLWLDVRDTDRYTVARHVLHAGYVAALIWYLVRSGPAVGQLPQLRPLVFPRWRYGAWIPVAAIMLILGLTAFSDGGLDLLMLLLMVATVWILIAWRRDIRLRSVMQGLVIALIALVAGLPAMNNGMIPATTFYLLVILAPPMYIAGGLLIDRTGLGGIQLMAERYHGALQSFFWGVLLFVPLGLINAADGSPGSDITWVTEWWMPVTLPWFSGIAEEILFRLLLVALCFFLLRPAFRTHPAVAVVAAVLFSGIVFGLGHGRTLERLLTTGLLYGVPLAVTFVRRDWEHAVGAHYMINMIPWLVVFLET